MRRLYSLLPLRVVLVMVLAAGFMIGFALNLKEIRREREGYEYLLRSSSWIAFQIEVEHTRFMDILGRYAHGEQDVTHDDVIRRFDIYWSRFPVALSGPEAVHILDTPGAETFLRSLFEEIQQLAPAVEALRPGDLENYRDIRARLTAMQQPLRDIVLAVHYGPKLSATRASLQRSQATTDEYLAAMLVTASLLVLFLFAELWRNQQQARREREARLMADLASRTKSEFLANMSHELRTPLNAVIGFAECVELEIFGRHGNPQYKEYGQHIRVAGSHLLGIINELLDMARIEAGRAELVESDFVVRDLVGECLRMIETRCREKRLRVVVDYRSPDARLRGDERLCRQILINLLANAAKFTPELGSILLRTRTEADGEFVIDVIDDGPGIPAEHLVRVLEPFQQVDGLFNRRHEGAGLGLPIARGLIELHGGRLRLESTVGVGTCVSVHFPSERVVVSPGHAEAPAA